MAFLILRQSNVVNSPNATIKGSPLSNSEVDNNFANLNLEISDLSNTVANLSSSEISNGTSNVRITVANGPITVTGNIIPTSDNLYSLGNANFVFADLFLSGNSLHLGNLIISERNGNLALSGVEVLSTTGGAVPADGSITTAKLDDDSVTTFKLADGAVTTVKIAEHNVTSLKLSNTGVVARSYGGSSQIPVIVVDAAGRITSAANTSITLGTMATQDANNVAITGGTAVGLSNIQSTGNITASGNIRASGFIQSTGNITAGGFFIGNGSQLTGLVAGVNIFNTTANGTYYPVFTTATSGSISSANIASTKLSFNANTGVLTATDFNSLSDITFKEDLITIENPLNVLKNIHGFEFKWSDTKRKSAGVIAQEVEKVLPHLVQTNSGIKSVNYSGLIGYLIETVKDLSARIDNLENKK